MEIKTVIDQDHAARIAEQVVIAAAKIAGDLRLTKNVETKRSTFLQYIITSMLSVIVIVSALTFGTVKTVQNMQIDQAKELIRLKTVQDNNVQSVINLSSRVSTLEINQSEAIKAWVDLNFVRKQ